MAVSPTQRTRKWLKDNGWVSEITEHWNHFAKIRQDLFGCIDIVALKPGRCVGIQTTTGDHHANRREKILSSEKALTWLRAGNELWIMSWRKLVKGGWQPILEEINEGQFDKETYSS